DRCRLSGDECGHVLLPGGDRVAAHVVDLDIGAVDAGAACTVGVLPGTAPGHGEVDVGGGLDRRVRDADGVRVALSDARQVPGRYGPAACAVRDVAADRCRGAVVNLDRRPIQTDRRSEAV